MYLLYMSYMAKLHNVVVVHSVVYNVVVVHSVVVVQIILSTERIVGEMLMY